MFHYLLTRLLLIPFTMFFIILINFVIICLAPGDPVSVTEITANGASRKAGGGSDPSSNRYLLFREFYGLTLPVLFNPWPYLTQEEVVQELNRLEHPEGLNFREQEDLRIQLGDQARFIMPQLLSVITSVETAEPLRQNAWHYFKRGAFRLGFAGPNLTEAESAYNRKITKDTETLNAMGLDPVKIKAWFEANSTFYHFEPSYKEKLGLFFFETRFARYFSRVLTLDFGVMRNDPNKTVISEVVKRFKYSLTLSVTPLVITFFLSLGFGMIMAVYRSKWPDLSLSLLFLILFAIPIFVVAPFLIEYVAMGHTFPFTNVPIPTSGFTSSDEIYKNLTTPQKVIDILKHIALPLLALLYGSLAVQSRIARTAFLEVLNKDYVRTATVKGVPRDEVLFYHVGRNAAITLVTSVAGSLGVVLGGSLIVETLFEIDGFGKFFYDAILNRDYNVIMFSAIAGSFLTLMGFLLGDIAYMLLDPRIRLSAKEEK
jgi:peptide/nickel transport system permease protein